jgi:hypothetical protein
VVAVVELFIKIHKDLVDLVVEEMGDDKILLQQDLLDVLILEEVLVENGLAHLDMPVDQV